MNTALRRPMSLQEFLAWEERQELRFEFDGFQPVAMVGVTWAHSLIQHNLHLALGIRLRGKPCRVAGSDMKIEVAGRIRYPDIFVVCLPVSSQSKIVTEPVVVFEILSESSMDEDYVVKNAEYEATPSIQRYVILEQTKMSATEFVRQGDDWAPKKISAEEWLRMPEIGVEFPLSELYQDIDLAD
jgi:Uma2 family endonuclease